MGGGAHEELELFPPEESEAVATAHVVEARAEGGELGIDGVVQEVARVQPHVLGAVGGRDGDVPTPLDEVVSHAHAKLLIVHLHDEAKGGLDLVGGLVLEQLRQAPADTRKVAHHIR